MSDSADPVLRVGCAGLPPGVSRQHYFQRLAYLETSEAFHGLPRDGVLRRWRSDAGEHGRFGLVAPAVITHRPGPRGYPRSKQALTPEELAQAGGFRDTGVVRGAVAALAGAVELAGADVVLFRSPPDFAPSMANREAMRAFFRDIAPPGRFGAALRVWEPQGLWEPEVAARFAGELGVVLACDPLHNDPLGADPAFFANLPSEDAYFRVTGLGMPQRRFDDYALEPLLDAAAAYRRAWIAFAHEGKYPDAIRLHRQLAAAESSEEG